MKSLGDAVHKQLNCCMNLIQSHFNSVKPGQSEYTDLLSSPYISAADGAKLNHLSTNNSFTGTECEINTAIWKEKETEKKLQPLRLNRSPVDCFLFRTAFLLFAMHSLCSHCTPTLLEFVRCVRAGKPKKWRVNGNFLKYTTYYNYFI